MLQETGKSYRFNFYTNFHSFLKDQNTFDPDLVIINPLLIENNIKMFAQKRNSGRTRWLGILYTICNREVLSLLDGTIQITDSFDFIKNIVETFTQEMDQLGLPKGNALTPRETDILKLMVQNLLNKDIACKLHISVHTVISHRRKIFLKTGTNKPYDLLNYAISNKIICPPGLVRTQELTLQNSEEV
jgi:DNA-binding CsgD family transcriptional regulator